MQTISEANLLSVIEQMLAQFPFEILGFHADNGSEYVNHKVARMLEKLRIEFTRSRLRHSNDNGLAETKIGAVVRKEFGYEHIHRRHAARSEDAMGAAAAARADETVRPAGAQYGFAACGPGAKGLQELGQ